MHIFATDTGMIDDGRNVWSRDQANAESPEHSYQLPVGRKPPTRLGLYDMNDLGYEWVRDWYASAYPAQPIRNPTGPASGSERVMRGYSASGGDTLVHVAMTFARHKSLPEPAAKLDMDGEAMPINPNKRTAVRCATLAPR